MNLSEIPMSIMRRLFVQRMWDREADMSTWPGMVYAAEDSPERFEIVAEGFKQDGGPPPATRKAASFQIAKWKLYTF